jgi:hypothetical protein
MTWDAARRAPWIVRHTIEFSPDDMETHRS